jgi:phage recombination protein Bet
MSNQEIMVQKLAPKTMSELLANTDELIYNALKNSVYPGASDDSIAMVLAYCKSKKYDPLAKVCHIVPMNVKDSKTGRYDWREVILPGIAGYRIDAHRTGTYVGLSEPEFGPMITENLGGKEITYPEWCKITAKKRMPDGFIAEFTATEYWKENYATKGKDKATGQVSTAPNVMWEKRGRGQLVKCTEAQILRKMFPEAVGNLPTFEEMEGKELKTVYEETKVIDGVALINEEQLAILKDKIVEADADEVRMCVAYKVGCVEELNVKQWGEVLMQLNSKIKKNRNKVKDLNINRLLDDMEETESEAA